MIRSSAGARALVFVFYLSAVLGAAFGANLAYSADNPEEASMSFNGTHLRTGENVTNITYAHASANTTTTTPEWQRELERRMPDPDLPGERHVNATVQNFARTCYYLMVTVTVASGDATAGAVYHLKGYVPLEVLQGLLNLAVLVPIGVYGYSLCSQYREGTA